MKKEFVVFLSPGTFVSEQSEKEIKSWDTDKAMEMAHEITERHGATPYGFYFKTRGRNDNDLDSKTIKESGMYFLGGRILTLADVKKEMPNERILISNMEGNGYKRVIINTNSWKSVHPFNDDDTLLDWKPKSAIHGAMAAQPATAANGN